METSRVAGYDLAFRGDAINLEVRTEGELKDALVRAREHPDELVFINLHLPRDDGCEALARLAREQRRLQTEG